MVSPFNFSFVSPTLRWSHEWPKHVSGCYIQNYFTSVYFVGITITQGGVRNVIPFYHPIKIVASQYRCCKRASEFCSSWKMR